MKEKNIEYIYIDAKGKTFEEIIGLPLKSVKGGEKDNKIKDLKNIKKIKKKLYFIINTVYNHRKLIN